MKTIVLRFAACFLLCCFLYPLPAAEPIFPEQASWACQLPAPENLRVTATGTTWLALEWKAVPLAYGYRVRVYEMQSGNLVANLQTTGTSITVNNLSPATNYRFTVAAICTNRFTSDIIALGFSSTIVLDLVLDGHPPEAPGILELNANNCGVISWQDAGEPGGLWLTISTNGALPASFEINSEGPYQVRIKTVMPGDHVQPVFQLVNETGEPPYVYNNIFAQILYAGAPACQVTVQHTGSDLAVCLENWNSSIYPVTFTYETAGFEGGQALDRQSRPESGEIQPEGLSNPVTDVLRFQLTTPDAGECRVQVFGMDGRLWLDDKPARTGDAVAVNWPVDHLPAGLYVLVVQTGASRQVIPLVKAR